MDAAGTNARSFGAQWDGADGARIWGFTTEQRKANLVRELAVEQKPLTGLRLLDAGCGVGETSALFVEMGAHVVGMDVADSVLDARDRYPDVEFVQADVARPPFAPGSFDIVYAGGVLHHTPNTKASFDALAPLVGEGGRMFVWLYHRISTPSYRIKCALRHGPLPMRRAVAWPFALQGRLRDPSLSLREHYLVQHDFFTPRWRWEHTAYETRGWFHEHGFRIVDCTSLSRDGFGLLGHR